MNTEPIVNYCPKCKGSLPRNAPHGLCPKCLLAAASTSITANEPARTSTAAPPLEIVAAAFPNLEILELIGSGGMGFVYKVRQPRLDRCVALKLLPQSLAAEPAFAERFNREARLLARLNHPNIVTVHDFGQSGGFFYLLMEFVNGVNLRQAMEAGRFTPHEALVLVPKICEALQYAHDEGILHRDIKPSNILLDTRGRVKIADFGIAKLMGDRKPDATLTASGAAIGTPQYMAPEQLEHPQDVDQRADIYSLGVVFYEMLTGELPLGRFAPPSQKAAVDSRVDDVVLHALEKEREKRFRSAGEVKTSVEAISTHPEAVVKSVSAGGQKRQASILGLITFGVLALILFLLLANQSVTGRIQPGTPAYILEFSGLGFVCGAIGVLVQRLLKQRKATGADAGVSAASGTRNLKMALPIILLTWAFIVLGLLLFNSQNERSGSVYQTPHSWLPSNDTLLILGAFAWLFGILRLAYLKQKQSRIPDSQSKSQGTRVMAPLPDADPDTRPATCYFSTPGRMRNCFPGASAHIFLCDGELRLHEDRLRFTTAMRAIIEIPFMQIREFGLGLFRMWNTPWMGVKYARFNYLVVTYTENEATRTVMLTPVPKGATSAAEINSFVARWHDVVQAAIVARTGVIPKVPDRRETLTGVQGPWLRIILPIMLCWFAGLAIAFTNVTAGAMMIGVVTSLIIVLSIGYFKMNAAIERGGLDAVTSDDPPSPELVGYTPALSPGTLMRPFSWTLSAWVFVVFGLGAAIETLSSFYIAPYTLQLSPGLCHLFAGIALLSLNRRWRTAALVALGMMFCCQSYFIIKDLLFSPFTAGFGFPLLKSLFPSFSGMLAAKERPILYAIGILGGIGLFAWPVWLMACARGKALFASPVGPSTEEPPRRRTSQAP